MNTPVTPEDPKAVRPPTYPVLEERTEEDHDLGSIHIHNSVIATIARMAAARVPGVVDLAGSLVDDIAGLVSRSSGEKGVRVEVADNALVIEISLIVEYGVQIPRIAWQVQNAVREDVERMTGKPVRSVNIVVQGIRPLKSEPAKEGPEVVS